MKRIIIGLFLGLPILLGAPCSTYVKRDKEMKLLSAAFHEGKTIPQKYTCEGSDISPPLSWDDAPESTKSFALIVEDPDAPRGIFAHWVVWNIDKDSKGLAENSAANEMKINQGMNSAQKLGYMGPCPPSRSHRYFFRLYALDTVLVLSPDTTKEKLLAALTGHILEEAQLMGVYEKKNH